MVFGGAEVTRKRLRWIAVQSVVVVALAVVVAVTLLKPESNKPLNGVTSGGNVPTVAQGPGGNGGSGNGGQGGNGPGQHGGGPGGHNGGHGNGAGGGRRGGGAGGHGGAGAPTGTATASVGATTPAPPIASTEASPTRNEGGVPSTTPTDDQYSDSVDAIDSALR
jgi:hypothetical protein